MDIDIRQLVNIFCQIDDFCKELGEYSQHYLLRGPSEGKRGPAGGLAVSEIMTILVGVMLESGVWKNRLGGVSC